MPGSPGIATDLMDIARSTDGGPILLQHLFEDLQPGPHDELEQLGSGIDQQIDQRQMTLQ